MDLIELIEQKEDAQINRVIQLNLGTEVTKQQLLTFSRLSNYKVKTKLRGAININGSGGTKFAKPNLSSLTALYLGLSTNKTIIKTGSRAVTGLCGSTDFFYETGLMNEQNREYIFDKYGFAYYDYLEVSPWKRYKELLRNNSFLKELFQQIVFFDYTTSVYFLGIGDPRFHDSLKKLCLENKPEKGLVTFYSVIKQKYIDELLPGKIYINNKLYMDIKEEKCSCKMNRQQVLKINRNLLYGNEEGYWKLCLKLSYCIIAIQIGITDELGEAEEMFEKAYQNKIVAKILKEIAQ